MLVELVAAGAAGRQDRERLRDQAAGQQGTDPQPGARDQEPAGRHSRRRAAAGDGRRKPRPHRIHPGHHPRGRPAAKPGRSPAGPTGTPSGGRCEHPRGVRTVRSLVLVNFRRGLKVVRDYDISIPSSGGRAQLIQAVLNIVQNAAQALTERYRAGRCRDHLRARVARQVTFGRQTLSPGTGIACHRQRTGCPMPSKSAFLSRWCRVGRRIRSGLTLAQTFVQRHHGVDRMRQCSGSHRFPNPDSAPLRSSIPENHREGKHMKPIWS